MTSRLKRVVHLQNYWTLARVLLPEHKRLSCSHPIEAVDLMFPSSRRSLEFLPPTHPTSFKFAIEFESTILATRVRILQILGFVLTSEPV
ncbi:hypothetical protein BHYA_0048g00190 [Botrytis hyacinthi]|uniref:Uncharacterized protein n=1 Tax=Botrytis hyacinthi TaxID=278943 RepID=A0A4Z1GS69_9HELO|nr:hypothetical protein BHYA_0048g00190 [Botrytis hyacinthi]